jgi:PrcB C-terminal
MKVDAPKFSLVTFETLSCNAHGPAQMINEVLHTQEDLDEYAVNSQNREELELTVAFPEERVVAVALGARPPGGYNVEIIAVVQETNGPRDVQNHVLYVEHPPHEPTTGAKTYPHHVIRTREISDVVSFQKVPNSLAPLLHALIGTPTTSSSTGNHVTWGHSPDLAGADDMHGEPAAATRAAG